MRGREETGVVKLRGSRGVRSGRGGGAATAAHTKIRLPPCHGLPQPQQPPPPPPPPTLTNKTGLAAPFLGQGFLPACDKMLLSIAK